MLAGATSLDALADAVDRASYIEFVDSGEGMSLEDLEDVYLTIGTRSRLEDREIQRATLADALSGKAPRPVLGEKGVGRLSAMRLGQRLSVRTSKAGEKHWNLLDIDWSWFSHSSDQMLDEVDVEPQRGPAKVDPAESGTAIRVFSLHSHWSEAKLRAIATSEFSKVTDPFLPKPLYPISLRFNDEPVPVERLSDDIFDQAHAVVEARFSTNVAGTGPRLAGRIDYKRYGKETTFALEGTHLFTAAGVQSPRVLGSV